MISWEDIEERELEEAVAEIRACYGVDEDEALEALAYEVFGGMGY